MQENADQNNSEYEPFLRSEKVKNKKLEKESSSFINNTFPFELMQV